MATQLLLVLARAQVAAAKLAQEPRDVDCIATCRDLLSEALGELDRLDLLAMQGRVDLRYLSPCLPGYDTVLGYLAKHNASLLDLIDKEPDATIDDGVWLRAKAIERGLTVVKVDACPWLKTFGIETVHAYPIRLLVERFGL